MFGSYRRNCRAMGRSLALTFACLSLAAAPHGNPQGHNGQAQYADRPNANQPSGDGNLSSELPPAARNGAPQQPGSHDGQSHKADESSSPSVFDRLRAFGARWRDFFDIVFAGLVAAFTVVIGVVSFFQGRALRTDQRFTLATLKAARAEASATANAARAAHRSADVSEKILRNLEVPYVYPVELRYFTKAGVNDPLVAGAYVATSFKNYGRAPAIVRRTELQVLITTPDLWNNPPALLRLTNRFELTGMLAANETLSEIAMGPIKKLSEYRDKIASGDLSFRFMIDIIYSDVFGTEHARGQWFVWDRERQVFVPGHQLRPRAKA